MTIPSKRDGAMCVYFASKWWQIGGWDHGTGGWAPPNNSTNEVWSSPDLVTWTMDLAHDPTTPSSGPGARFKPAHWFGCFVYNHAGTDYVYRIGGDSEFEGTDFTAPPSNGYDCEVWRSTDPGNADGWTRVATSDSVSWTGRDLRVAGASPGKLWVAGGQNGAHAEASGDCVFHNDLHVSTDGGATWSQVLADAAPSSSRPQYIGMVNKLAYWRRRLWLVGGGTTENALDPDRHYPREVWSFDPEAASAGWTKHTNPPWLGGQYNEVEVFGDRLWLFSGYSGDGYGGGASGLNTRWMWSTQDGETWRREETPPWEKSHADGTAVSSDGLTMAKIAGNGSIQLGTWQAHKIVATPYYVATSVPAPAAKWVMSDAVLSGSDIVSVPDSSGNGHTLVPFSVGDAKYTASNADFGGAATADCAGVVGLLHSTDGIDLSSYTIIMVAKLDETAPAGYWCYALNGGDYVYVYTVPSSLPNYGTIQYAINRGATLSSAQGTDVICQAYVRHVLTVHYDGTAAGSMLRIDGATTVPDLTAFPADPGTGAFTTPLYLLSDSSNTSPKPGSIAECRVYSPALTLAQIQAVERELAATYPYTPPP